MICFLTSRADDPNTGELNTANHFAEELRLHFPRPCRALTVSSDPDGWKMTDFYAALMRGCFEKAATKKGKKHIASRRRRRKTSRAG